MVKIIDGTGTSKTRKLMTTARQCNGVFVCSDVDRYTTKAHAYGIVGLEIVHYNDFISHNYTIGKPVFINKLDECVSYIGQIEGFTLTID